MKKTTGFYLINIIISVSMFLILINIGSIYLRKQREIQDLKEAKTKIYEVFTTYRTEAFSHKQHYNLKLDYIRKTITISKSYFDKPKIIQLPTNLKYITIFDKLKQKKFLTGITFNGNISQSFSIYIFDYNDIARYRISIYGFDLIKYFKINSYKNSKKENITYDNILEFHNSWDKHKNYWKEE